MGGNIPLLNTDTPRIAVMGTHSVGKTTLARMLAGAWNLHYIPEQAREVAKDMGYTPATIPVDRFCEFQRRAAEAHYVEEVTAERGFIADRSIFDYGVYFNNPPSPELAQTDEYEEVKKIYHTLIRRRAPLYSFIIYIPKMFDLVQDQERHGEIEYQELIQAEMENKVLPLIYRINTVAESEIPVCTLLSNGPEARVAEVQAWAASIRERKT